MRKVIAAINMTLDGYCDHTAVDANAEIHQHYTDLLNSGGTALYGRTTYKLMEDYWPTLIKTPSGTKSMDDFAKAIDNIPKVVFSRTLKNLNWETARLSKKSIKDEVLGLRQEPGKDIFVCSPSLIVQCGNLGLIDEYQLCVHPVIVGKGLPLFKNVEDRSTLKLVKTKLFNAGAVILYYTPTKK